jgi:hypothetical protein
MATNYLNNLNNSIKISSSTISNADSRDALTSLSRRNAGDLNNVANYINSILVPGLSSICSKPRYPYDAVESGISGLTLVTYPEAQGNNRFNSALYWIAGPTEETGRPATIKESFDYLLSSMIDRVVEVRESITDLNPVLDQVLCTNRNIIKVAKDAFGDKYASSFICSTDPELNYPLGEHIYQIIHQLTGSTIADELNTGASDYPELNLLDILNVNINNATQSAKGVVEIATAVEAATAADSSTSNSGAEIVLTPTALKTVLGSDDLQGELQDPNLIRNLVKTIADERIAASDISALNNVNGSPTPASGDVLSYIGGEWKAGNVNVTSLLGTESQDPNLGDLTGRPEKHGDIIAYDREYENVRVSAYYVAGMNTNYYRGVDLDWSKDPAVVSNIDADLKRKSIPFVLKLAPSFGVFDESSRITFNTFSISRKQTLDPRIDKSAYIMFYQNTCNVWDTATQEHTIDVDKILGVCRSDFHYGEKWIAEDSNGNITGQVTNAFSNFMLEGSNTGMLGVDYECIQDHGVSPVMVLGEYSVGDKIYLLPGKVLDMIGIRNNIGICITDTWLNRGIDSLSEGATDVTSSLMDLLKQNQPETFIHTANWIEIISKPLGVIVNKYNDDFDITNISNNIINTLCYNLVNATYDGNATNDLITYINQQTAATGTVNLFSPEWARFVKRTVQLSLPLVKLSI